MSTSPKSAASAGDAGKDGGASGHEAATVTGKVRSSGGAIGEAYVYIDGLRSSARGHTVEVKQRDKQFAPRVLVVPLGTQLVFPNQDTVIHNVFSTAPGNSFDLGSVKGGETSPPVVLLKPGPVEIFCNIHSKMRADVLVVPNNHWTRVAADGSFSLSGVPVGSRRIVLWSPTLKPISQQVDVTPKGGTVTFTSEAMSARPHLTSAARPTVRTMSEPQAAPAQKQARASARGAGVIGALLLVVGLLLIATGVIARTRVFGERRQRQRGPARHGDRVARPGRTGAATAARALEPKAMAASRLPEIVSGLDLDADAHTFEDLLENEDWWAPYRTEFALSAACVDRRRGGRRLLGTGDAARSASGRVGRAPGARRRRRVRGRRGAGARVHGGGGARAARQARLGRRS